MQKKVLYTRNLEPLQVGTKLPNITIYDHLDNEIDLSTINCNKMYISIPSFSNAVIMKEMVKLDTHLQPFQDLEIFLISNETSFVQKKFGASRQMKKLQFLSDFKNRNFARYTGTYIYEIGELVKAVFLVNSYNEVVYVSYYDDLYSNINIEDIMQFLQNDF